ncbi:MAG: hypothetical protein WBQ94_28185 [Terracidiphilus sp.]
MEMGSEERRPGTQAGTPGDERGLVRVVRWILGTIGHVQVTSPEFDQKIRARYQSEISQLKELGFDYQFTDGQTISIFRLPLLLPAILVIGMLRTRRPMTLHGGTRILIAYPVCISRSKTTFSEIGEAGFSFHTAFQDGTILVTKGYQGGAPGGASIIVISCPNTAMSDAWAGHQKRVQMLEAEGKRVERNTTFEAWAETSDNETARL